MSDHEALQDLLKTVKPLAASGLRRPNAFQGGQSDLTNSLALRWVTKQRLIERLLTEADPRDALDRFEARTQEFQAKYPDLPGWKDKAGIEWRADLVLAACDEVRTHLDSWDAEDDFTDDEDDDDEGGSDD